MSDYNWINELFESIDSKDAAKFASFISENGSFKMGNLTAVEGRANIEEMVAGFFGSIQALKHTDIVVAADGNYVVTKGNVTYTRHSGSQLSVGFCTFFTMDGDKIHSYEIFVDASQLYAE